MMYGEYTSRDSYCKILAKFSNRFSFSIANVSVLPNLCKQQFEKFRALKGIKKIGFNNLVFVYGKYENSFMTRVYPH